VRTSYSASHQPQLSPLRVFCCGTSSDVPSNQGKSGVVVATTYVGLSNLIACCIFWWYLYIKPNVREFFERRPTEIASAA
jgi:hypothetical protein